MASTSINSSSNSPTLVSAFNASLLAYNIADKSIAYNQNVARFITHPMLCVGVPVQDVVNGTAFTTLQLKCDSTSAEKTKENHLLWQSLDKLLAEQSDIQQPYLPLLRGDGTLRLKIIHHKDVKVVDRNQNTTELSQIVPGKTYCKFIIDARKQIVRQTSRTLGVWVHFVMIKPADKQSGGAKDSGSSATRVKHKGGEQDEGSSECEESDEGEDGSDDGVSGSTANDSSEEEEDDSEESASGSDESSQVGSVSGMSATSTAASSATGKKSGRSAHKPRKSNK